MEATPATYRADIAHTHAHIARIDAGDLLGDTDEQAQERRTRLVRQVANLERALGRAAVLWAQAQAQAQDAGTVVVQGAHWRVVETPWKDCYVVLNDTIPHRSAIYHSRERAVARWAREEGQGVRA